MTVKLRVWLWPSPALQISAALSQAGLPISSNSSILPRRLSCGHAIPQLLARQKTNIRLVIMNLITFIMTLIQIDTSIINKKKGLIISLITIIIYIISSIISITWVMTFIIGVMHIIPCWIPEFARRRNARRAPHRRASDRLLSQAARRFSPDALLVAARCFSDSWTEHAQAWFSQMSWPTC